MFVCVTVGVDVGVRVAVSVGVPAGGAVGVSVDDGVGDGLTVSVGSPIDVGDQVPVAVADREGGGVSVWLAVGVGVRLGCPPPLQPPRMAAPTTTKRKSLNIGALPSVAAETVSLILDEIYDLRRGSTGRARSFAALAALLHHFIWAQLGS